MIIAIELHPGIIDMEMSEQSENVMQFAIIQKEGMAESLNVDAANKKDMARTLIAHNIGILVTRNISLEPFVLLKSYGIRVYAAAKDSMPIGAVLEALKKGELTEITADNYGISLDADASNVVTCKPSFREGTSTAKEAQ